MAGGVESPASSCVSSDAEEEGAVGAAPPKPAMVVVGCPRCLMYVMVDSEAEQQQQQPRCPRCKSPVLLHFVHGAGAVDPSNTNRQQGSKS
ncbi:hypothetical protein BRADI_5g26660v3 [Brachypodium distachyon]|uniref:GIR1-like zinc ribbon domain-containing protein n=1 Tax=Brachypodium distachyon TaxID=15368 RepID=I1J3I4_BRADI|nr:hypothetical protein BRADI_5g26660v3 [Brachypodium distachyon]